ncbi:nucleotidyltransferases [Klebsormidium nitens]|uniref:Translation initiation factor eIF2B subunit gamma n=1 Tax=Klebsormidium nitens TaxID=105231 RepID=A0A0U9HP82_KLENI|nr:nucleotidyltransferases [Klebsormidium nitens]|eukprot:GAQ86424.1 nucleotidyltransferases [Klebsormidium nitens]
MPGVASFSGRGGHGPMDFDAVVLAGGLSKQLYPLVSKELPKALLPVGNKPVLSYTLEMLEANNLTHPHVVVAGEEAASRVRAWISDAFQDRLTARVTAVPEDSGTAEALRAVAHQIRAKDFIVLSGDLVCDVALGAVAAAHCRSTAAATALLCSQPNSSFAAESKDKGKATTAPPVDYIGLTTDGSSLLFCASAADVEHELRIRRSILRAAGQMVLRTDLMDTHLYVFNRVVLDVLEAQPGIASVKRDLLPYLVRTQLSPLPSSVTGPSSGPDDAVSREDSSGSAAGPVASPSLVEALSHPARRGLAGAVRRCGVYLAGPDKFCNRLNSLQQYIEVNREVAGDAVHLTGFPVSSFNNVVHPSVEIGSKTTVGAQCVLGEGVRLGDKCSVKRSVLGKNCRIGANVKIINSVLMAGCVVEDGCHVQNSVVSAGGHLQERASLKDCYVGAAYTVGTGEEHRGESLAKKQ